MKPVSGDFLKEIYTDLYLAEEDSGTNVFLCGSSTDNVESIRFKLNEKIKNELQFNIIYPEWLFSDLLATKEHDLLTLERYLADIVDLIVIPLESPGTFTELGSFASNAKLRGKIFVLNDAVHRHSRSFIAQGPIALIKKEKPNNILYYEAANLDETLNDLVNKIRYHKKGPRKSNDLNNIFNLSKFLLHLIAIHQPITLNEIEEKLSVFQPKLEKIIVSPALNILFQRNCLEIREFSGKDKYKLSPNGYEIFQKSVIGKRKKIVKFSKFRSRVLNDQLRSSKHYDFGGDVLDLLEIRQSA